MNWFGRRKARNDRLVMSLGADALSYGRSVDGRLVRCGVEPRGDDTPQAFARRVRALGLQAGHVTAVLALHDCHLLQIDAPAVPAAELKAAARWRIKDLVDAHLDDLTLDVMVVGDDAPRNQRKLFVAAAQSRAVRDVGEWSQAAGLELAVIDIRETAQRNLQTAVTQAQGRPEAASAALMQQGEACLLTICAHGELFYARRLPWNHAALTGDRRLDGADSGRSGVPTSELAMLDIVDYGAADAPAAPGDASDDTPRFVIELQRSLDLWERSWPDLPLARLMVHMEDDTEAVASLLRGSLALPVEALRPEFVFADLATMAGTLAVRRAVVPLLGALLREESRRL
jgi:MSHA biogenesis protein MshI